MPRRLIVTSIVALIASAGLAGALALRAPRGNPVLGAVPIGNPLGMDLDGRLGRAFILDDGVLAQQVTLNGNGWTSSGSASDNKVRVVDTRTGRLVKTIDIPAAVSSLTVDTPTSRVFAFGPGLVRPIDARSGATMKAVPFSGNPGNADDRVDTTLVDRGSGRIFAAVTPQDVSQPANQHVLMLDGRTGATLRNLSFPHGPATAIRQPDGTMTTFYPSSLSLTLDERAHRLYVVDTDRHMSVVDSASGRVLSTRRLSVALAGVSVDGRTGHIFAAVVPPVPSPLAPRRFTARATRGNGGRRQYGDTPVVLDPRDGSVRPITPRARLGDLTVGDRVFRLDRARRAVDVLDRATGRAVRTVALDAIPLQLLPDAPRHRVLITGVTGSGPTAGSARIAVLDARSGALLRTVPVGQQIGSLLIDAGNGHLVAACSAMGAGPTDRYAWLPSWLRGHLPWVPPPPPPAIDPRQRIVTNTALTIDPSQ